MKRIKPCYYCKKRRRKCERPADSDICLRCSRLKIQCFFDASSVDDNDSYDTTTITAASPATDEEAAMAEVDGNSELQSLYHYVQTMERQIQQIQLDISQQQQQQQRQQEKMDQQPKKKPKPISYHQQHYTLNGDDKQQQQQLLLLPPPQYSNDEQVLQDEEKNKLILATNNVDQLLLPSEWKLTIINGHLRLETGINTLGDLLRYRGNMAQQQGISYLSPFGNATPVRFKMEEDQSMMSKALVILTKNGLFDSNSHSFKDCPSHYYDWNNHHRQHQHHHQRRHHQQMRSQQQHQQQQFLQLQQQDDPADFFQYLVPLSPLSSSSTISSFSSFSSPSSSFSNSLSPVASCYDQHYDALISALSSSANMDHLHPSAPGGLVEIVDCPEIMMPRFIQQYMHCYNDVVPLIHEKRLISRLQEYQLDPTLSGMTHPVILAMCCFTSVSFCRHLPLTHSQKRLFGEYYFNACREQIDDMYDDPSPHRQLDALMAIHFLHKFMVLTLRLKELRRLSSMAFLICTGLQKLPSSTFDEIETGLLQRHSLLATITFTSTEFFCDKRMDEIMPATVPLDILPDESELAANMLTMYKTIFELVLHHDCVTMVNQIRRMLIGEVGQVTLEALIRFDNLCLDWWNKLPPKWRICENPFESSTKDAIENCDSEQTLAPLTFLLTLCVGIHSSLMHPHGTHSQVSSMIQIRAMEMTLTCCELMMVAADRLKIVSTRCGYSCEFLFRVYDSLQALMMHSTDSDVKVNRSVILSHMNRCIHELTEEHLVSRHRSELLMSPMEDAKLEPWAKTYSVLDLDDLSSMDHAALYETFSKYPLPGHALMYDIIASTARKYGVKEMPATLHVGSLI